MTQSCTHAGKPGDLAIVACKACGHNMLLHPSVASPALTECLACRLVEIVERLDAGA